MKRVYLIRHRPADFPKGKRMCLGRTDLPLSAKVIPLTWDNVKNRILEETNHA